MTGGEQALSLTEIHGADRYHTLIHNTTMFMSATNGSMFRTATCVFIFRSVTHVSMLGSAIRVSLLKSATHTSLFRSATRVSRFRLITSVTVFRSTTHNLCLWQLQVCRCSCHLYVTTLRSTTPVFVFRSATLLCVRSYVCVQIINTDICLCSG